MNAVILTLVITSLLFAGCSGGKSGSQNLNDEYDVAAYIWASCHHDERFGDMLWPIGQFEFLITVTFRIGKCFSRYWPFAGS
jgi:hypothetical protein